MKKKTPRPLLKTVGPLTYHAAREVVLALRSPFASVKLCRLGFGGDGSVYVMFPYLDRKTGLLSELELAQDGDVPVTYDLATSGVEVSCDVKFSHHTSGVVAFSRTGLDQRLPRRQSFSLPTGKGAVFWFFAYWLNGFQTLEKVKARELTVFLDVPQKHPFGLKVEASWVPIAHIVDRAICPTGPVGTAVNIKSGAEMPIVYIGQPDSCPLRNHVLVLTAKEQRPPDGADVPTMIFLGGFDDAERPTAKRGCLAFMYPVEKASTEPA